MNEKLVPNITFLTLLKLPPENDRGWTINNQQYCAKEGGD